jgi:hypothetical protein
MQKQTLLALLSLIPVGCDGATIQLFGKGQVQISEPGMMPTNYQLNDESRYLLKVLKNIVNYNFEAEYIHYEESCNLDQVEAIDPGKLKSTDVKGHILHDLLVLKELIEELETPMYWPEEPDQYADERYVDENPR